MSKDWIVFSDTQYYPSVVGVYESYQEAKKEYQKLLDTQGEDESLYLCRIDQFSPESGEK